MIDWHWALIVALGSCSTIVLLVTRLSIRQQRSALINELAKRLAPEGGPRLPQLELVQAKYMKHTDSRVRSDPGDPKPPFLYGAPGLLLTAVIFTLLSIGGFALIAIPIDELGIGKTTSPLTQILLWTASDQASGQDLRNAVSVTAFSFLGAYFAMILYLQKAVINFELSALSFARASLMLLLGSTVATVLHRGAASIPAIHSFGQGAWPCVAFLLGLFNERALSVVIQQFNLAYRKVQTKLDGVEVISPEIVEGIDSDIAFRLQESNIYDVQNLATYNPIQLHVETPFGLFEAFDWILQAQLCVATGKEVFEALRSHGIRTIFDLERAVLACGTPDDYVRAVGSVLFSKASPEFRAYLKFDTTAGGALGGDVEAIRHAVAVMADDLHVHRLREVWRRILHQVGGRSSWLFDVAPLPGEDGFTAPPEPVAVPEPEVVPTRVAA